MLIKPITEELFEYCKTNAQESVIKHLFETQDIHKTATDLSMNPVAVKSTLKRVRAQASLQGYSPEHGMVNPTADTHYLKGDSTLYDSQGRVKLKWVKTDAKKQDIVDFIDEFINAVDFPVRAPKMVNAEPDQHYLRDRLTVYPMGDPHIGMYAWFEETGIEFNHKIAEEDLKNAVDRLVDCAPSTETALVTQLGDFFHADDSTNQTRRSGNTLDVSGRHTEVMRVGLRVMIYLIQRALDNHKSVRVINEIGNHDDESSLALSLMLDCYFHNEPRVHIDTSPSTFHYFQFGKVFIGVTHGHNTKYADLGPIMATDKPKEWGDTKYRYWYVGHVHHQNLKEFPGVVVESFRTLAGRDAWHNAQGYRAGRDMKCIVHHKDYGEVERHTVNIDMIR